MLVGACLRFDNADTYKRIGWQCCGFIRIISSSHLVMSRCTPLDTFGYELCCSQSSQLA